MNNRTSGCKHCDDIKYFLTDVSEGRPSISNLGGDRPLLSPKSLPLMVVYELVLKVLGLE